MQPALKKDNYLNFLKFSLRIRILCNPETCVEKNDIAKKFLTAFVNEYSKLYGAGRMTYNTHNLVHLANDVMTFQCCLDRFSCFPFESYFKKIQSKLQNSPKPLHQLVNRMAEEKLLGSVTTSKQSYPSIKYERTGQVKVFLKDFFISNRKPNNLCMDTDGKLLLIQEICDMNKIVCFIIKDMNPLFLEPCDSRVFDICIYQNHQNQEDKKTISAQNIRKKCLNIPYFLNNMLVSVPIIHSNL